MNTYAGDVTPQQAYAAVMNDPEAVLVDVRTQAEWNYVGLPDLREAGSDLVCVEWQSYPSGRANIDFFAQLRTEGVTSGRLYFLCRSGTRSQAAAAAAAQVGFEAYNVLEGFEGALDSSAHRTVGGWKNAGLPWRQS